MHEFVLSGSPMKKDLGIKTWTWPSACSDHGYHPPTVYFPLLVDEALLVEPTETETKETLDGFAEAVAAILTEAGDGSADRPERALHDAGAAPGRGGRRKAAGASGSRWRGLRLSSAGVGASRPPRRGGPSVHAPPRLPGRCHRRWPRPLVGGTAGAAGTGASPLVAWRPPTPRRLAAAPAPLCSAREAHRLSDPVVASLGGLRRVAAGRRSSRAQRREPGLQPVVGARQREHGEDDLRLARAQHPHADQAQSTPGARRSACS